MTRIALTAISVAIAISTGATRATAGSAVLDSAMDVSFAGIPIGTLRKTYSVNGNRYSVVGSLKSNRMVSLVAGTKANFSSSGRIAGTTVIPAAQRVKYKSRRRKGAISLAFAGGNVHSASVLPKKKFKPGTVPLKNDHRLSVLDPVSALVISVADRDIGNGLKICNRSLPVFDGTSRYDLQLSYKSKQRSRAKGFSGNVFTCNVRYKPIAGHRPHKKNVKFLRANRDMQVTMARIGNTNTYGLFSFRVKTRRGTAKGKARIFASR